MALTKEERQQFEIILKEKKINFSKGWENFTKNQHAKNVMVLAIDTIEQLQMVMRYFYFANQNKSTNERSIVRVAAGGLNVKYSSSFSISPCAKSEDVILNLHSKIFKEIKLLGNNIVLVGAGVTIGELDTNLYRKHGLVLPASSLIGDVTAVGLIVNAGHGTGKDQPSIAGLVKAMTLCLPNGDIVRIDEKHPDFATIRGASLGLFGTIINVELQCAPAQKLKCRMNVRSVAELIEEIKQGLFIKDPYVSVMYVPTYQPDELTNKSLKNVIIYRSTPVSMKEPDVNMNSVLAHFGQDVEVEMGEALHITNLLRQNANLIPNYMRYIVTQFAIGVRDEKVLGPWPEVMHYRSAFPSDIDDAGYLFESSVDCHEIVAALINVVETLNIFAKQKQYPITDAIYLRFLRGTNGGLSTSAHAEDKYVCAFDMVSSNGIKGYAEFKQKMSEFFIDEMQAKPHFGKYIPPHFDFEKAYGKDYLEFLKVLKKWYGDHQIEFDKNPLLNAFHQQIVNNKVEAKAEMIVTSPVKVDIKAVAECMRSKLNFNDNPYAALWLKEVEALCQNNVSLSTTHGTMFPNKTSYSEKPEEKKTSYCNMM